MIESDLRLLDSRHCPSRNPPERQIVNIKRLKLRFSRVRFVGLFVWERLLDQLPFRL